MNNDVRFPGDRSSPVRTDGRTEPRSGSIIAGRFQVDKLIARGGMSTVYLAHQVRLNRPVALKVLTPPPSSEEAVAFEQRFRREGQTLAALDHTNIVVLYDYGETEDGRFFLAMEYIDGPRLSDLLRDGPLPVQRALNIIVQVAAGLRYAHKRGVVHRDLKPSNLLIRRDENDQEHVKIVDFGLVKLMEEDQNITRAGLILGSPHCMSPEQVKGLEVDHRADIYALGVLLFRSLTGQYPFHGANSAATMVAHLNHPIPTFYSVAPELEVPRGLEEVVRRCLAKSPNDRFSDMRELIAQLTPLMEAPPEGVRTFSSSSSMLNQALGSQSGAFPSVIVPVQDRRGTNSLVVAVIGVALVAFLLVGVGLGALFVGGIVSLDRAAAQVPATPAPNVAPAPVEAALMPTPAVPSAAPPATAVAPPAARPAPAVKPAAVRTERAEPPPKKPAPKEEKEEAAAPEGYLGLPKDLMK